LKQLSQQGSLNIDKIFEVMTEEKANQKEHIRFKADGIKQQFPKGYTVQKMQETTIKVLGLMCPD
jgi:ParB family chromosome partitioning protein